MTPHSHTDSAERPFNYLPLAILVTLCCNPLLGMFALWWSARANTLVELGDLPAARSKARKARKWLLVALIVGIAVNAWLWHDYNFSLPSLSTEFRMLLRLLQ